MPLQLSIQGLNIVLRGKFNPALFHPAWFAAKDLIRQQEAEAANIQIVHPNVTVFSVEWLQVHITQDRFQLSTVQEAYYETLRDLVIGTFDLLGYTPLKGMGINRDFHYQLESEKAWHSVGDRLAPKQDWTGLLDSPGLRSLLMEGKRPDELPGHIWVKVEPSTRVNLGVYIEVNDHYALPITPNSAEETGEVIKILSERWPESVSRSLVIAEKIAALGELE